jgi:type I restriction-modification system DNA methylase subunit
MNLFQNKILKKHITTESDKIKVAYQAYSSYFHNPEIQENIKSSKEEQFQEGFLCELFVKVLGYTLNPAPHYNLITEQKNETNSKKADGAILVGGEVTGIIELKDSKTTDLKTVETQAFGYKNNNRKASYVVTSNFEKLRFYIENAIEFIEFNLFTLTLDEFSVLWICLAYENISKNLPKQIKAESVSKEDQITKNLYKDYSQFKRELFADLTELNPQYDKLLLFKKSQKLLDRLLFIMFAEDRNLLPPNSLAEIVSQWKQLRELDAYQPLYDRLKLYFSYMNTGHKGKKHDIFAYNGGLFKRDEVLDTVTISDEVLCRHTLCLSQYDFESEVDVNILGHIFENSLTEIEEITQSIAKGESVHAAQASKRKKDGVFYTPRYITTYIVENTLGKLCAGKKSELGMDENEFAVEKRRQKATKIKLADKLQSYREWLLSLTICDPACGSGAFLNAALDYLINEHRLLDELNAKLYGDALVFPDIENAILENNLYGVDINEESVEIAKLALWLRTAKPHRKLNSLNDNIKCGNSLISDPEVAGEKAFNWHKEFPQVFDKGGFDVVIGNPPYGAKIDKIQIAYLSRQFADWGISFSLNDTYFVFYVMSLDILLANNGILGFITPNTWKLIDNAKIFRKTLLCTNYEISQMVQHLNKVFEDATVDCDTLIVRKRIGNEEVLIRFMNSSTIEKEHLLPQETLCKQDYFNLFLTPKDYDLKEKIVSQSELVKDAFIVKNGIKPYEKGKGKPAQTEQTMIEKPFTSKIKKDDSFSPLIGGSYFHKYLLSWNNNYWIQYGEWLAAPREKEIFEVPEKLIFRQTSDTIIGTLVSKGYIMRDNTHILLNKENSTYSIKYALAILNSKLLDYFYWTINPEKGEAMAQVKAFHLGLLPIKNITLSEQQPFIEKTDQMLSLNADLQTKRQRFLKRLSDNFDGIKINTALEHFDESDFKQFVAELKKQKIILSLKQQDEWEEYFNEYKSECNQLSARISETDNAIDKMVYELYGLTEEEIGIVEKGKC